MTQIDQTEEQLHLAVARYLNLVLDRRVLWTTHEVSNQQGGWRGKKKQKLLKDKGQKKGWPDIELTWIKQLPDVGWSNKTLHIELKTRTGRVSKEQKAIHEALRAIGRHVAVCRSVDHVVEVLQGCIVPRISRSRRVIS